MEPHVGANDAVLHIKQEFSAILKIEKMENEEEQQPEYNTYMETNESNLYIKSEEIHLKLEENDYGRSKHSLLPDIVKVEESTVQQLSIKNIAGKFRRQRTYSCQVCTYRTIYPENLKFHMVSHKDLSDIKMYKCRVCPYQSKFKYNRTMHMIKHKSTSEVQMYNCELCSFQTKYKRSLAKHMFTHCQEDAPIYKCDMFVPDKV